MSLDELELILCDMYEMDEWLPNPVFDKNGFAKTSSILTGRLPGNTYLIREGIIENRPYKT